MSRISWFADYLLELKEKFQLKNFVETGYGEGDSVTDAINLGFDGIYSCDIVEQKIKDARARFTVGKFFAGESIDCLPEILKEVKGRTFFWLDAHLPLYCGAEEKHPFSRWPLVQEIDVIKRLKKDYRYDVIATDDVNHILLNNENAYINGEQPPDQMIDFIDFESVKRSFADTHDIFLDNKKIHGVLFFIPKESV